jgi:hypothetical protein
MGRGVAQYYAEGGESATYAPSQEPEGSTPATEPTNESFNAESKSMFSKDKNGKMYARRRNGRIITHNAEDSEKVTDEDTEYWLGSDNTLSEAIDVITTVANGIYTPEKLRQDILGMKEYYDAEMVTCAECGMEIDEEDIIGDGTSRGLCCVPDYYDAESKSMFSKDKNGKMYARRRNGRIITHNAEHEGVYACSKCKHWNRNPVDGITKCKKCGNGTFTFVKKSEFMPDGDGNVVGQQTFGFNGTPLHAEEDTSFGLVGEGNNFGQMRAEGEEIEYECYECGREWTRNNGRGCPYGDPNCFLCDKHDHSDCDDPRQACDLCNQPSCERTDYPEDECDYPDLWEMENEQDFEADFSIERPFQTGVKLSAGLLTGAALFGLAGATLTALIGSMMDKGE